MTIPVSVIIVTKNEEAKIATCLAALEGFSEVVVVDSQSQDKTKQVSANSGVNVVEFVWNKAYPKKRQWCLDNLSLKHDWIFFVDADEIVTPELKDELRLLFTTEPPAAGYFMRANYISNGKLLKHGLKNNKLVLFDRRYIEFPVIDDLDIPGMGEIEGHYQPVLKPGVDRTISQLKSALIHDALDDDRAWVFRHKKYARWERGMNDKNAWPDDPKPFRDKIKKYLRQSRFRPDIVFFISFILMGGFMDGVRGWQFAKKKKEYYTLIRNI